MGIDFRILGPIEVAREIGPVRLGGPKQRAVLTILLLHAAGEKTVAAQDGSKAPVSIFVEETGKTGFAYLTDLASPKELAQVNPGDYVELTPEGGRLIAKDYKGLQSPRQRT